MDDNENKPMPLDSKPKNKNIVFGVILVVIGLIALAKNLFDGIFMGWNFVWWPIVLIVVGIVIGGRHQYKGLAWWMLILFGAYFLLSKNGWIPFNFEPFKVPLLLVLLGVIFILKRKNNSCSFGSNVNNPNYFNTDNTNAYQNNTNGDFFDISSVFASNERRIITKSFKGGRISCTFGGAELDFTQADFEGYAVIDVFTVCGGVELTLPGNWIVKNEMSVFLGGIDDKRRIYHPTEPAKTLILKGNVVCGGVEIKSY